MNRTLFLLRKSFCRIPVSIIMLQNLQRFAGFLRLIICAARCTFHKAPVWYTDSY